VNHRDARRTEEKVTRRAKPQAADNRNREHPSAHAALHDDVSGRLRIFAVFDQNTDWYFGFQPDPWPRVFCGREPWRSPLFLSGVEPQRFPNHRDLSAVR